MIRDVEFVGIKLADKFPNLADKLKQDIKYEIYLKGVLHPYMYIYYQTDLNKFSLRIRINYATTLETNIGDIHNDVVRYCNTLQEARKFFYLYQLSIISPTKGNHWYKWLN